MGGSVPTLPQHLPPWFPLVCRKLCCELSLEGEKKGKTKKQTREHIKKGKKEKWGEEMRKK